MNIYGKVGKVIIKDKWTLARRCDDGVFGCLQSEFNLFQAMVHRWRGNTDFCTRVDKGMKICGAVCYVKQVILKRCCYWPGWLIDHGWLQKEHEERNCGPLRQHSDDTNIKHQQIRCVTEIGCEGLERPEPGLSGGCTAHTVQLVAQNTQCSLKFSNVILHICLSRCAGSAGRWICAMIRRHRSSNFRNSSLDWSQQFYDPSTNFETALFVHRTCAHEWPPQYAYLSRVHSRATSMFDPIDKCGEPDLQSVRGGGYVRMLNVQDHFGSAGWVTQKAALRRTELTTRSPDMSWTRHVLEIGPTANQRTGKESARSSSPRTD